MAPVSSGRSDFDSSSLDETGKAGIGRGVDLFDRRAAAVRRRLERGRAHRDHFLARRRLDGLDGVAGIDRPAEHVRAFDRHDLRNLRHIEFGGDTRQEVLAVGGGRREEGVVVAGERQDQRLHRLGQHLAVRRIIGEQHLFDARNLGGGLGHCAAILAGHQHMDGAAKSGRGGHGLGRRILERRIVVFGNDERGHQITPASFLSLSRSSATDFTLTPAWRLGGSVTFSTLSRGVTSTP